jgi:DNA-directed RNA polymerase specialized sigma24 family protein
MDGTVTPGGDPHYGRQHFLEQLREIWQDPAVKRLALRRSGDPELASDVLNQAYYAVARRGPEGIRDLRAYYCRTLINVVSDLRSHSAVSLTEDFERIAESHQDKPGCESVPRLVDETVCSRLLAAAWLEPFAAQRGELAGQVPRRSSDPNHYRAVIVAVSERVLRANATSDVSDADSNPELIAAYPEWFAEPGCAENTRHQRFSRARADVRDLLRTIVSRDDLYS